MSLSPVLQRLLALVLLIGLCGLAYALLVGPYLSYRAGQAAEVERLEAVVLRYRQLLAEREDLADRAELLAAERDSGEQGYLAGDEPSIAVAELQQILRTAIDGLDATIRSVRVLPAEPQDGIVRIGVTSQIEIDHEGLRELFYAIETAGPVLFIDSFLVSEQRARQRRREREEDAGSDRLDVTATVFGFMTGGRE